MKADNQNLKDIRLLWCSHLSKPHDKSIGEISIIFINEIKRIVSSEFCVYLGDLESAKQDGLTIEAQSYAIYLSYHIVPFISVVGLARHFSKDEPYIKNNILNFKSCYWKEEKFIKLKNKCINSIYDLNLT